MIAKVACASPEYRMTSCPILKWGYKVTNYDTGLLKKLYDIALCYFMCIFKDLDMHQRGAGQRAKPSVI